MPIPTASAAPSPVAPPSGMGADWLPMRERPPWTLMVAADRLTCRGGHIVPDPIKHAWTPGGVNAPADWRQGQRAQGAIAGSMATAQAIEVPHRMQGLVAFGQSRDSAKFSAYIDLYENGPIMYAVEAWQRPRRLGSRTVWEWDEAGYLAFLLRLLPAIAPDGKLLPIQVEIATAPIIRECRLLLNGQGPRVERLVRERVALLPREHVPADLAPYAPVEEIKPAVEEIKPAKK